MKIGNPLHEAVCRVFLMLLPVLACLDSVKAQCPAATPLVINSVTATQSRCEASGTATVSATGGSTPYTYSIIAGPVLSPAQSSNVFQSLTPGTYTVKVTDNCNTSVTSNFTVTGTYTIPTLSITSQAPSCPGSSDGSITVNVTNGRAPLKYSLISPSPVTAGPQAGNVFSGLPAGNYTVQVSDSCGNFQTQTVGLVPVPSSVLVVTNNGNCILKYLACDSFAVYLTFNISNYKPPYTITATLPNGSVVTQVLTAPVVNSGSINDTLYIRYNHVTGNTDLMPLTITNQCGMSSTGYVTLSTGMDMSPDSTAGSVCGNGYTYTFDEFPQLHCSTVTYTLVSPSGAVLATQTNNSTFSNYPPGTGYKVIRQDCCSRDTLQFNWSPTPPFHITYTQGLPYGTCKEGTTTLYITYNYSDVATVVLVSGPPSIALADGTVYTYTYPDTAYNVGNGDIIGYFGPGTYKLYAIDNSCGQKDSLTLTFGPGDMRQTAFGATLKKGCNNANKILLSVVSNNGWTPGTVTVNSSAGQIYNTYVEAAAAAFSDSIVNLPAGTYYASYQYSDYYWLTAFNGMSTLNCDVTNDTIIIPSYTDPSFSPSAAVALCGTTRNVALLPDSADGVSPYQYQIIAGPTTTSVQSSPVFPGLSAGTYTFQMTDACNNSYSSNITINTLALPTVSTIGGGCAGGDATFTVPGSPFYSYTWLHPNGTITTGDTLAYNPITSIDTGMYTITLTSTVGGCTSTSTEEVDLGYCTVLAENLLYFSGEQIEGNIQLNWETSVGSTADYFVVERSTDAITYTPIKQVYAAEGVYTYTMTDTHVPSGVVYYRLKTVDKGGAVSYSHIISFNNPNQSPVKVYPTFITDNTLVNCTYPVTNGDAFFRVIGVDGRTWRIVPLGAGTTATTIDMTGLPAGNYFVVFTTGDNVVPTHVCKE